MYILPSQSTICMISTAFIHIYSKWGWSSQLFIPLSRIRKFNLSCEDTLNQALCKYIKRFVYLQNEHWKSQVGKDLGRSQVVLKLGYEIRFCCSGLYPVASWKSPEDIKCTVSWTTCSAIWLCFREEACFDLYPVWLSFVSAYAPYLLSSCHALLTPDRALLSLFITNYRHWAAALNPPPSHVQLISRRNNARFSLQGKCCIPKTSW